MVALLAIHEHSFAKISSGYVWFSRSYGHLSSFEKTFLEITRSKIGIFQNFKGHIKAYLMPKERPSRAHIDNH